MTSLSNNWLKQISDWLNQTSNGTCPNSRSAAGLIDSQPFRELLLTGRLVG